MKRLLIALLPAALVASADEGESTSDDASLLERRVGPGDLEIGEPGTPIQDAAVARQEASRFRAAMKDADTPAKRIELLERLGKWDHEAILKEADRYVRDRDHTVAIAAIKVVAKQATNADKAGRELAGALKREDRNHVICALLIGLGKLGYDKSTVVREAVGYFRRDTSETHKAATRYLGFIQHKPSFRMIAEKLDEPRPKNPSDPNNPPASYWKERWIEWNTNVKWTRWALSQIVPGETFEQTEEAKNWCEKHGREHDVEW